VRTPTFDGRALAVLFLTGLGGIAAWSLLAVTPVEEIHLLPCPMRSLWEVPCPGCGMSRACLAIARGEFSSAWGYHPFAFGLVGLALATAVAPRRVSSGWDSVSPRARAILIGLALACALGLWVARLG